MGSLTRPVNAYDYTAILAKMEPGRTYSTRGLVRLDGRSNTHVLSALHAALHDGAVEQVGDMSAYRWRKVAA